MKKKKKWSYHKSHSFKTKSGSEFKMLTQLYQIGVYVIVNDNPAMQMNLSPNQLVTQERKLRKLAEAGEIIDLEFGMLITVIEDENGMYKELKEEN